MVTKKQRDILCGEELFRLTSSDRHKNNKFKKYSKICFVLFGLIPSLLASFHLSISNMIIYEKAALVGGVLYYCVLVWWACFGKSSFDIKHTLVITDKGLILLNTCCSRWTDLESYSWQKDGIAFTRDKGMTLVLIVDGFLTPNPWMVGTSYAVANRLAGCKIFFTPEQIAQVDEIFKEYGVRKVE